MIYLDVTSAAASPVNMGVQRMVRGIYALLKPRPHLIPVRWDFWRKKYALLSPRELDFLDHPFALYQEPSGAPGAWDPRHLIANWKDAFARGRRTIENDELLRSGHTLLIPDLCWDPRIHAWSRMAHLPGRKIAIFHDAMPLRIPGQADSHDKLFATYVRSLARLDFVICISQEVEQDLLRYWKEFGLEPKPTRVITWPVPFEGERPAGAPNQEAHRIIYVARLKLRKNHLVLLDACASLWQAGEKFDLDLIGIADAFTDTRTILRRVNALAAKGRPVRWRKHISDEELAAAYRDCSFTAFPSRLEGFGLPIIESLWHGRPVICGRNGAIGEVAQGGGCFQVDQNNPVELAGAIRLLLSDSKLYHRLFAEARERTFRTWDDYRGELDQVLKTDPPARR
jgi:glycosyltransferase involved in cell wall biosynthesis